MLRRTAFCFHYYLKLNITHTSDIVVKRPRKASAGIQSHGILTFVEEKKTKLPSAYVSHHTKCMI